MRFTIVQRYTAPPDDVQQALLDPAFLGRLGELPTIDQPQVLERRREGDRVHQRVRYRFTGALAPVVRTVVDPARLSWVEESTVDVRNHRTTFRMRPDHYPDRLECQGSSRLTAPGSGAGGGGTVRTIEADLVVHMPMVGGRVERAIVSGLQDHAAHEARLLAAWLRERG
jgi:hypothetical protein